MQTRVLFFAQARAVKRGQSGVALVVVLIFMLALAGMAIVSAKSALLGEAVSRNQLDIQVARQAAEAALRDGEKDLLLPSSPVAPAGALCSRGNERPTVTNSAYFARDCIRGQCGVPAPDDLLKVDYASASAGATTVEAWWPVAKGGLWNGVPVSGAGAAGGAQAESSTVAKPAPNATGTCATFSGGVPIGTFTGTARIAAVVQQPEYMLEHFSRGVTQVVRITARGFGYRPGTEVLMQSYFLLPEL